MVPKNQMRRERENIFKNQMELLEKNTIYEIENTLGRLDSKLDTAKDKMN